MVLILWQDLRFLQTLLRRCQATPQLILRLQPLLVQLPPQPAQYLNGDSVVEMVTPVRPHAKALTLAWPLRYIYLSFFSPHVRQALTFQRLGGRNASEKPDLFFFLFGVLLINISLRYTYLLTFSLTKRALVLFIDIFWSASTILTSYLKSRCSRRVWSTHGGWFTYIAWEVLSIGRE